ncbi:putative helicase mot1 [Toxocara canis]|uniref:Putative helicase mot1 n=1 Tax=Toxocara canis TaxID=6265 RepID=A0A0B2VM64_TOXCA|nr:putative helicase mot1 [Toxocara canis]
MMGMYMDAFRVYVDEVRRLHLPIPNVVIEMLPDFKNHHTSKLAALRFCAARCVATIARLEGALSEVLNCVVVPLQKDLRSGVACVSARCGLAELLFFLSELDVEIIGALRVVAPLSLRLMTDNCEAARETAALAFRNFVPLMALKVERADSGKSMSKNDVADQEFADCSMDLLLGNPSKLAPLHVENIKGLCQSVTLRPYQQEGIRWMSFLEEYGLSGILADDMGLGKTLQALCLLALKISDKPTAKVLIVCPPTLVGHWCTEWSRYFPNLAPFHKVNEGIKDRKNLVMSEEQFATVASYNSIRACPYFQEVEWYYVILDEGHAIRNPMTQIFKTVTTLRSQNRLILSGTPVQNTPADLWALFQFLMPGYLGSMKQFKVSFLKAINACRNVNASAKEIQDGENALDRLHKAVLPFVLRRLKSDVLEDLPEKIVQDYMCTMTGVQRALYEHIIELCKTGHSHNACSQPQQGLSALEVITELRSCIVHPLLVSPKARNSFNLGEIVGVAAESGKMKALGQLLRECGIGSFEGYTTSEYSVQGNEASSLDAHRALIFCQRLATVQVIAEFFNSGQLGMDIRYSVLDGTVPVSERHAIAENFNNDPGIDVLLLTTSVGGEGLNLTGADVVIFVEHDWNPVKDLQAMDRAHRIGQKRTVNVYRLITEASIEQKILRYQKFKTDTANALVGADNRSLQTMATEQLVELFATEGNSSTSCSGNQLTAACHKLPKRSASEHTLANTNPAEKWNLEDLWDQSQYDRFDVVNIAMESEGNASLRSLKRHSSEIASTSGALATKQLRRDY